MLSWTRSQDLETMPIQNLGGETKSVMAFSEVAHLFGSCVPRKGLDERNGLI